MVDICDSYTGKAYTLFQKCAHMIVCFLSGWKYYGRGMVDKCDDYTSKVHTLFQQCMDLCAHKRADKGEQWNGLMWRPSDGFCECMKDDRGHDATHPTFMHFKI